MAAHVACRPRLSKHDDEAGCFVVCAEHDLRISHGFAHERAVEACTDHNQRAHA